MREVAKRVALFAVVIVATVGLIGVAATAMAQEQAQPEQQKFKEEVEVTGTLIPRPTLEAMSPVSTLDPQEIAYQGTTRLEELLGTMPQVFEAQNSTIANGATGTATVDLRYMGSNRTLVLIDGKRMPPGDVFSVAGDLNFIPAFLVKRIDILTGGASATYGADAMAGVVNFVIDRDFEGLKAGILFGGYEHNNDNKTMREVNARKGFITPTGNAWDGDTFEAYAAFGGKFADGKGHASVYVDYRHTDALLKKRRDYTYCSVLGKSTSGLNCGGSQSFRTFEVVSATDPNDYFDWTLDTEGPGNTLRPWTSADVYNYGAVNFMQRPDVRWTAGGFVNYKWNEHFQGYLDVMMMSDITDAQIAPSADFFSTNQLNCDNPMLSADEVQKLCTDWGYGPTDIAEVWIGRRNVEGGGRNDHLEHNSYRVVGGLKGAINDYWSYDVYGLYAQTSVPEIYQNDFNSLKIQNALIVDGDPNDPSTWQCRYDTANCVPWNIFRVGGVTQAAIDYLKIPLLSIQLLKTEVVSGKITGDLKQWGIVSPWATEGFKVAFGGEWRREIQSIKYDQAYLDGIGAGQGGPGVDTAGYYQVKEAIGEALIPLIQGMPFARDLSLELGYRFSSYNLAGDHTTWKVQGTWAPSASIKFRGGQNRAVRAPNIRELFRPQGVGLYGDSDPCAGSNPQYTQAQCANTGVTAAQYGNINPNPAQQYNAMLGGNPDLRPETADTNFYGFVFTPTALPGLTAAFDYYKIKVKDTIGTLSPDDILVQCAVTGNPTLCNLIHRNVRGSLWMTPDGFTQATNNNIGKLQVEGVDANLSYLLPIGNTFLNFNLVGSYLIHSAIDTGLYAYDCVGLYGNHCGQPSPHWRHMLRITWEAGKSTVSAAWRMVGPVKVDESSDQEGLYNPASIPAWMAVGSYSQPTYNWFDFAFSYKFTPGITFTLGCQNLADKEPPIAAGFSDNDYGTGFYGFYDPYGRYIHSSIMFNF